MRVPSLIAASAVAFVITFAAATPAFAASPREDACTAAGGTLSANNQTCTVVDVAVGADLPFGDPSTTYSEAWAVGDAVTVDISDPVRQPSPVVTTAEGDVGDAVVVRTERAGTGVVTFEERDAGAAASESVVAQGTPTSATRVELGASSSTESPTAIDCVRINDPRAAKAVERCDRAMRITTTTPTTLVTTTTTPQQLVTTTTQPRETLITTTTPYTEVFTSTQQRELCTTLTYATLIDTRTTQTTERTATTVQPTTQTTVTTTTEYGFQGNDLRLARTSVASQTVPGVPVVTQAIVDGAPIITTGTRVGPDQADTTCEPIEPVVTATDGETRLEAVLVVEPAASIVTVQHADIEPLVVETSVDGAPIVTVDVRPLAETCMHTPAVSDQRKNRC